MAAIDLRRAAAAVAVVLGAVGFVLRFDGSALPEVSRYRDDAYYYFVFVRSLAAGDGPCVTPGEPTSGVHFLWALLLWPLASLFGERGLLVGAQHLGLGLHALTALGLWFGLGRGALGAALAALYFGNPVLVAEVQNGQETALACLATLLLWLACERGLAATTVATVAATFARSDLLLVAAALSFARFGLRGALPVAAAGFAYVGVNVAVAGHWLQDSASPIPWLFATHFERTGPDFGARVARLWWYLRPCLLGRPYAVVSPAFGGALVAAAAARVVRPGWRLVPLVATLLGVLVGAEDVAVPLLASLLLLVLPLPARGARAALAVAALAGFAGIVVLHLVLRTYPRDYYFAPLGVLGALACTALPRWVAAALAVLLAAGNVVQLAQPKERFPWQEQMGMAGRFLREVVPPGEPVGSFNSGIVAFHDPGPVVNLDGVVHRAAFEALRAGDLDAWLDRRGIRFLVDSAIQFAIDGPWPHSSGAHFGAGFAPTRDLVELARCVVPGVEQPFVVYHRRGRGAPPPPPEKARVLGPAPAEGGRRAGAWVLWPAHGPDALALRAADGSGDSIQLVTVDRPTAVLVRVDAPRPGRWALVAGDGSEVLALDL